MNHAIYYVVGSLILCFLIIFVIALCKAAKDDHPNHTSKNFPFQALVLAMLMAGSASGQITFLPNQNAVPAIYTLPTRSGQEVAYKECTVDSVRYLIRYDYNSSWCTVPATDPPGAPHYSAMITVYRLTLCRCLRPKYDTTQVGEPFDGEYVKNGCFEDIPENHVKTALGWKRSFFGNWLRPGQQDTDTLDVNILKKSALKGPGDVNPRLFFDTTLRQQFDTLQSFAFKISYDTIPVLLLVTDTSMTQSALVYYQLMDDQKMKPIYSVPKPKKPEAYWIRGFRVTTGIYSFGTNEYLDENRKPLTQNIIIWQTR